MPRASLRQRKDGRFKCKYKGIQFMGATQSEAYAKRDAFKSNWMQGYGPKLPERSFPNMLCSGLRLISMVFQIIPITVMFKF